MGTRIPLMQIGSFVSILPPMGLSISATDNGGCWSKSSFNGDLLSSCAVSFSSVPSWRVPGSPGAKAIPTVSRYHRTQSACVSKVRKGFVPTLTMRRGQHLGNSSFEKLKVRSLVDEATAHSSDLEEMKASSSTSPRSDADAESQSSELEVQDEEIFCRGQQLHAEKETFVGSSESGTSSDFDGRDEEAEAGIEIVEASTNPIEMDYEDMKVDRERDWSIADMKKVDALRNFEYRIGTEKGVLVVQVLRVEHMKAVEELLVDSFAELMGGLLTYRPLLTLTVRQYVRDRYACLPDAVTLIGLYAPAEDNVVMGRTEDNESSNWLLAGTVELSFSNAGHPDIPAGPSPPPGSPYLCNMAVSSAYRRRGIGRELLKAAEELAASKGCEDLYLHCRMVDMAPLNMYQGAGYQIVATDSILSLLSFQRRRYLMKKRIHPHSLPSSTE
ncbi:hypothetical protein MPTK1_1g05370 [Marchantia polymorpha subsp. ruderalis]|uniref:N-acetyltransferase domain-containing protein n=2 Tax=Marchantia polymorpha TaxID=3197 RepID=A0AAF6ALS4_MARPO|nr:hypothetical protein MARPO_0005s0071 [Marchantia polymorpha]PTQ48413.1 hypothetical protein MARPO_0005s0071 [Marchantia polymorpha]BBM97393.1 hypothetical protein Mp_1g05370 [Marchantia polymorpha subsp. ruderalis]BBM97394.1 hypothetical protein Mp_1g05370 [Marchantia polymorpha subsp. ruderalis]|eukprot:PTQ48412.1 hypothetical protein MARPO_0005s0071 [Marchantia polymorpha]